MPNYPKHIYLQNNLRLTEKRTVRQFDARILGVDNSAGPTQRPNYAIPVLDWINERIIEGDIIFPITPETSLTANDSSSIDFTTSGTANHTLTGVVKVSGNAGNQLSIVSNGLFVPTPTIPSETPLTANDSSTIDFSTSGTANHTITGSVLIPNLISTDASNQLVLGTDNKLYVTDTGTFNCSDLATCSIDDLGAGVLTINGLSGDGKAASPVKLGGTLNQNTTIDGASNVYNLIFNNIRSFEVTSGTSPGTAGTTKAFYSFDLPANYSSPGGYSAEYHTAKHYLNGYNLTNGRGITSHNVFSEYNIGADTTIGAGSLISGTFNVARFKATAPNVNLTRTQGQAGATLIRHLYNHVTTLQLDSGSTDVTEFVTFNKFANHAVTTNYDPAFESNKFDEFIQIYIGNAKGDAAETTSLKMPNTYGIWQEGADDKNLFRGRIILPAISTYADDTAAGVGGLTTGTLYKTATGEIRIKL